MPLRPSRLLAPSVLFGLTGGVQGNAQLGDSRDFCGERLGNGWEESLTTDPSPLTPRGEAGGEPLSARDHEEVKDPGGGDIGRLIAAGSLIPGTCSRSLGRGFSERGGAMDA